MPPSCHLTRSEVATLAVALSTKNLIANPGAEIGPVSTSFATDVAPTGWTVNGTFTGITYATGGGGDLNVADSLALQGGTAYLAGGTSSAVTTAR